MAVAASFVARSFAPTRTRSGCSRTSSCANSSNVHPDPLEESRGEPGVEALAEAASLSAGPPTRFRYLVGAAVDSLSRLRPGNGQRRSRRGCDDRACQRVPALSQTLPDTPESPRDVRSFGRTSRSEAPEMPRRSRAAGAARARDRVEARRCLDRDRRWRDSSPDRSRRLPTPAAFEPDLSAAARLCTELSRVDGHARRGAAARRAGQSGRCRRSDRLGVGSTDRGTDAGAAARILGPRCSRSCRTCLATRAMRRLRRFARRRPASSAAAMWPATRWWFR